MAVTLSATPTPKTIPSLTLTNEDDNAVKLSSLKKKEEILVLVFVSSTCPVSSLYWDRFKGSWYTHRDKDVAMFWVGGNTDDTPEALQKEIQDRKIELPILWDNKHSVAKTLGVEHTPLAVIIGKNWEILYRGRIDDSWRDETKVKERWLESAIQNALKGKKSPDHLDDTFLGCHMR